ncbi:ROK family protein [Actinoplanes sp. NPDC026619]|uniref:ROK family protein n=1 Tax=Actinoplanes sp. NPDC026619 TaxID=3155798 RepID=UPI0033F8474F
MQHRDLILAAVREAGRAGRTELVRRTGMARATVNALVTELLDEDVLAEEEASADGGRPGRPARSLTLGANAGVVVGAVVAASGVRVAAADLTGQILAERDAGEATLDALATLIAEVVAGRRVWAAMAGLSAPIAGGVVQPSSVLPGWAGLHPAALLKERLGYPVGIRNDADLALIGELRHGVADGRRDVLYLRIATGIGCGLLLDGVVQHGASGVAGEIGHVQVDETGTLCRCGNRGCLETIASPREILASLTEMYGEEVTAVRAVQLAANDAIAERVLADAGRMIGRVVADLANTVNPALVVLDGPLITEHGPLVAGVADSVRRYAQPEVAESLEVRAGELGDRAALIGAVTAALHGTAVARGVSATTHERDHRRDAVLDLLRRRGVLPRSDIARVTRLPRSAVADLLDTLVTDQLVEQCDPPPGEGRSGRPSPHFRVVTAPGLLAGLAVRPDGVQAIITDMAGTRLHSAFQPQPMSLSGQPPIRTAAELARSLLAEHGLSGLKAAAVSVPSPVHPRTGLFGPRGVLPMFAGFSPAEQVAEVLGVPATAGNNAHLAALGETRRGAARDARDVLYLRADQYTGGGILAGGRMYRGAIGYAGEVGHLNVREVGPLCICGSRGCLSTYLSPRYFLPLGGPPSEERFLQLVAAGDRPAQRALLDAGRLIGRTVAPLCNALNPQVVVVGGRFIEAGPHVVDGIRESLHRHCAPAAAAALTVRPAELGADAEIIGAVESLI